MAERRNRAYSLHPQADKVAWGYIRRLPAHVDRDDVRQVAQIAAWQAEQDFDGTGNIDAWVTQCIRWRLLDLSREATRHTSCVSIDDCELDVADQDADPATIFELNETYIKALQMLPVVTRNIVERTLAGSSGVDIGREYGVDPSRIWQHLDRAKRAWANQQAKGLP